ncbi:PR-1-like protein [Hygrophoropsis aurantiaca]|uniref:PR-1-like protein n=1 Tax=Hygrophoropsis aurantiaca TaxID=72124 RepID=A0ACB8AQ97_9AGAM|nr:PR-1-like protein [Hygrophoropsis aurantiaca]
MVHCHFLSLLMLIAMIATASNDIKAYLDAHNHERAKHKAKPLHWDESLARAAQKWADHCKFEHSKGKVGPYGASAKYNSEHPQYSHWTQVVWKSTTHVGCAVQTCNGMFEAKYGPAKFYVCEYSPPGNYVNEFSNNVS